ncbi:MAG: DUF3892 domain-containing protein [Nanoarchaeota archaeon]|nr:DUF3892 domain-containing protein [Nanoarchaeota archaeon]
MRYQIVCTTRKTNNSIDKLGYVFAGSPTDSTTAIEDKEKINEKIRAGHSFFFTNADGKMVDVVAVEDDHVRTKPDGTEKNNLLHLRICRIQ